MAITHTLVSAKADGPDATLVQPSDWNANHTIADIDVSLADTRTATVARPLTVSAETTGVPAADIGTGILVRAESADEAPSNFGALDFRASDVTAGSEDTYFEILLRVAGAALAASYRFVSTTAFRAIFTHSNTADRTYSLPNVGGGVLIHRTATTDHVQSGNDDPGVTGADTTFHGSGNVAVTFATAFTSAPLVFTGIGTNAVGGHLSGGNTRATTGFNLRSFTNGGADTPVDISWMAIGT